MKNKRGYIFMVIGALLIAIAVGLALYNHFDEKRAGEQAVVAYEKLYEIIDKNIKSGTDTDVDNTDPDNPVLPNPSQEHLEMRTETVEGREFVGIVSIPALHAELPVQSSCSDEQLRYSPCRYKGNILDSTMIIAAHNYVTHFGKLNTLQKGDEVVFTDVDGISYSYKVVEITYIDSTAVQEMEEPGDWDLTLFTCTYGNRQRVTVRCIRSN